MNLMHPKFKNKECQACIKRNIEKSGSFSVKCDGIRTEEKVSFAMNKLDLDEHTARWMYDPSYFFGKVYGSPSRDYQDPILACTARRLVGRQCRQTGKSLAFIMKIVQYAVTNKDKTILILTPAEKQIKKLWDEYIFRDCIDKNPELKQSISRKTMKPFYEVVFDNGSKIMLMVANEGARGQTADIIYIDEAAMIPHDMLNSIIMTVASKAEEAMIYLTSTPKGRGNYFYKACKEFKYYNEFHVTIDDVPQMHAQREEYKELLGEAGYMQECMAEFPDSVGGPFNFKGVDLAKRDYRYKDCVRRPGKLYFGGVDWNGPNVGTYFYIIEFDPDNLSIRVVDKAVIAQANWNSIAAKNKFIDLNRKWEPKKWNCDYGYGHTIVEELKAFSIRVEGKTKEDYADKMIGLVTEPIAFGAFLVIKDPFTKEDIKKTTRAFIVSQVSKLFEPQNGAVPMTFSKHDKDMILSLENYKLLQITDRGVEKYGFNKKDGIEDHAIDAFMLACYGIVQDYNELFKRMIIASRLMDNRILEPPPEIEDKNIVYAGSIVLLTDNHPESIELDGEKINDPYEAKEIIVSRGITKGGFKRNHKLGNFGAIMSSRGGKICRKLPF